MDMEDNTGSGNARNPYRPRRGGTPSAAAMWGNNTGGNDSNRPFVIPSTHTEASLREQDIIVPSTDSKGATVMVKAKVTPAVERAMSALLESRRFPFQTQSDIIRAAIVRFLNDCAAMDGSTRTIMEVVRLQRDTQAAYTIQSEVRDLMDTQALLCQTLVKDGEMWEARRMANDLKERITALPESAHKRQALKRFTETFAELLTVPSAALPLAATGTHPSDPAPMNHQQYNGHNQGSTQLERAKLHRRILRFEDHNTD